MEKASKKIRKNGMKFQARTIVFTVNNPKCSPDVFTMNLQLIGGIEWFLYQEEKGENGTIHYQGMAHNKNDIAWTYLKSQGAHLEKCWSPLDSITYCTKQDTRISGPYEWGKRPSFKQKKKGLPTVTNQEILEVPLKQLVDEGKLNWRHLETAMKFKNLYSTLEPMEDQVGTKGIWYYGKSRTGKSYEVRRKYGYSLFLKPQSKWWDGYQGQENVLLDDFDKPGKVLGHYLKIWADGYACTGEVKGATVHLKHNRFIITSQYIPAEIWKEDEDPELIEAIINRFEIIHWDSSMRHVEQSVGESIHPNQLDNAQPLEEIDFLRCDEDININSNLFDNN